MTKADAGELYVTTAKSCQQQTLNGPGIPNIKKRQ